ncbi:hypothetical protein M422DRAFT_185921 [Sphaerobolus stellatus SS14]|uniref:AAA+ ATPase domain-containing protein n=1 Tax=Sphaerobolus stellatus (strain SS14) TaxID=990650 RepID=A0A0C9UQU9_SPHS4|nr:hypothetical protein M422DRAFT_185921 [Sphaerobolus stellatus SS14]
MTLAKETKTLFDDFFPSQFSQGNSHAEFAISQKIKDLYPQHQHIILLSEINYFLSGYLKSEGITLKSTEKHSVHDYSHDEGVKKKTEIGLLEFAWNNTDFMLHRFSWPNELGGSILYVLVFKGQGNTEAEQLKIGEELLRTIYQWGDKNADEEIFVFVDGTWTKDVKLKEATQTAKWENLVLEEEFISNLKRDTETFFSGQDIYSSLEIPWKRGILLLGPPGNGKTESIKVLLKENRRACLYVRSFTSRGGSEYGIRAIFEFARRRAPCILVLEDLDSMVTPSLRAFFLNELDGLEKNEGILTIATSNHPEKIDDAILNRPSRFDVKYMYALPTQELRKTYIEKWNEKIKISSGINLSEILVAEMAEKTEGFSFAFMKEL